MKKIVLLLFFVVGVGTLGTRVPMAGETGGAGDVLTSREREWLKAHPVIRLAPDPQFKPIEYFDSNGNYSGIAADYVHLLEGKLGIRFEIVRCVNWDDVITRAKNRDVDVLANAVTTPQRKQYLLFPTPYLTIPSVIIVRKNVNQDLTLDQLNGMQVVMVSGYGYVDLIRNKYPKMAIDLTPDLITALHKVSFGISDAFVGDLASASFYIESEGITNLKMAGETDPPNISGFAVRSDWPELSNILEKGVALLTHEEKTAIFRKWIHLSGEPGVTLKELRDLILIMIGVSVLIILGFLAWNRILKRVVNQRTEELRKEIDERKRAQEALGKSEAHLRTLVKTIPDLVWLKDADGVYLFCNSRFERFFGKKEDLIVGKTDYDFQPRDMADFFREHDLKAIAAGGPRVNEETVTYADDGHTEHLETIKTPVYDTDGHLIGVLGIARDITERKRAETEREKLQDQLFQARKMDAIGRLAGGVAHDFNNMLSVIIGRSELARLDLSQSDPLSRVLTEIETVGKRSADLTRQLLAFARKQTIMPEILDLNQTIESLLRMLGRLIGEGIELIWAPKTGLWPVNMDPAQVNQVLANLVINARDAIGGQVGKITIGTENCVIDDARQDLRKGIIPGEYVRITVMDTGCGMDTTILENIFEPFFTTKNPGKGTGLGLSTIYGIVMQNNGFILVDSEPGKGARFSIHLPRYTGNGEEKEKEPKERKNRGGTETILIVEDELQILDVTRTMLESLGYSVIATTSPNEAIRVSESDTGGIDLLITDVVMPEMNGKDLSATLKKTIPGVKCLYMSGYTADVIAHHGILDEGIHFIQKPFTIGMLAEKVRTLLDLDL